MASANSWFPSSSSSSSSLASAPAESSPLRPPPFPPDPHPPDPSYLTGFPPLTSPSSIPAPASSKASPTLPSIPCSVVTSTPTSPLNSTNSGISSSLENPDLNLRSQTTTVQTTVPPTVNPTTTIQTSPFPPNSTPSIPQSLPQTQSTLIPIQTTSTISTIVPTSSQSTSGGSIPPSTLAEKLKKSNNKSLRRYSQHRSPPSSKPRVKIPQSVFKKGEEIHKDFVVGQFLGRPPPFKHIQNVLSSVWNKGIQLEIHLNPNSSSMLIRLPNEFLRGKILEKKVWHIGEAMFYVYAWNSRSTSSLDLGAVPIWAHLEGVPLELRHEEGLSRVAEPLGEPIETDEFTLNLVSLTTSHVKVEADLTLPMPTELELEQDDGSLLIVKVSYPWLPPSCSHCKKMGHVIRFCPQLPPHWELKAKALEEKEKDKVKKQPSAKTSNQSTSTVKKNPSQKSPQKSNQPPSTPSTSVPISAPNPCPDIDPPIIPSHLQTPSPSPNTTSLPAQPSVLISTSSSNHPPIIPLQNPFSVLASIPQPPNLAVPTHSFLTSTLPFFPSSTSYPQSLSPPPLNSSSFVPPSLPSMGRDHQ